MVGCFNLINEVTCLLCNLVFIKSRRRVNTNAGYLNIIAGFQLTWQKMKGYNKILNVVEKREGEIILSEDEGKVRHYAPKQSRFSTVFWHQQCSHC